MSVAVGLETEGGVWLAWDSAFTSTDGEKDLLNTKGFTACGMGVAAVGSGNHDLALRYSLAVELPESPDHVERWACTTLCSAIEDVFKPRKLHKREWGALFAVRGVLIVVDENMAPYRPLRGYMAVGTGGPYALGALHATVSWPAVAPSERYTAAIVTAAARASCAYASTCSEPVHTLWVPNA